jgi:hypothetical protein
MDEAEVIERMALIAHDQAPEVAQPGEETLDLPTSAIASERTAILRLRALAVAAMRCDHLHPKSSKRRVKSVGIIGSVANESVRQVVYEPRVERGGDKGNLMRRSRGGTSGERKTKMVCHCHELRPFAPLGLAHASAPFFATTKVPSIKHSDKSIPPRSLRSWANASRIRSSVPSRTQRWKRRWHVWYGGYRSGRSAHWAPVRRIQRMPFNTSRLLRQGRPRPSGRRGNSPITGSNTFHCSSVRSIVAASSLRTQLITHL